MGRKLVHLQSELTNLLQGLMSICPLPFISLSANQTSLFMVKYR